MKLDILVFGVHPDDVELSCGGILLTEKLNGKKTGVIDLTQGELGTRGTVETRKLEAASASNIMQLDVRENLQMADGFFVNDNYVQDKYLHPNFVMDISDVMDQKLDAIKAYTSQFNSPDTREPQTYISSPDFLESVIYRAKMYGKMIGVKYAEGFISKKMIGFNNFDAFIKQNT